MIPVAAPGRVSARLAEAADGPREVLHASATAIYVDLDGWCLGLVSATASRVPCALWSALPDLGEVGQGGVLVEDSTLVVGSHRVRVGRLVDARPPRFVPRPHRVRSSEPAAVASMLDVDLPPDGRVTPDHVGALVGRGPGLTPLGDDVLAGWLVVRHAAGAPDDAVAAAVRQHVSTTTLLSATLLDCALHGEALPQLTAWLGAPTEATERALLAIGATSGAGLLAGASLACASLTSSNDHPRRAA